MDTVERKLPGRGAPKNKSASKRQKPDAAAFKAQPLLQNWRVNDETAEEIYGHAGFRPTRDLFCDSAGANLVLGCGAFFSVHTDAFARDWAEGKHIDFGNPPWADL